MQHHACARYGIMAQFFHWATALLVLVAFIYGPEGSEQHVYLPSGDFERQLHETLGLCVFALACLRVLWRMIDTRPAAAPVAPWMAITAHAIQGLLYLLLFAVPLTAITGAWLEGHPLTLLAGLELAPPVGISHAVGASIATIHPWLADTVLWLAGFHAVASLYHHFFLKDGVLVSMLPRWLPVRD